MEENKNNNSNNNINNNNKNNKKIKRSRLHLIFQKMPILKFTANHN